MATDRKQVKAYITHEDAEKFKIVADFYSRTVSKQIEFMLKQEIKNYEAEHGKIILEE